MDFFTGFVRCVLQHIVDRKQQLFGPTSASLGVYRVPVRLHADVHPEIKVWVIKQ